MLGGGTEIQLFREALVGATWFIAVVRFLVSALHKLLYTYHIGWGGVGYLGLGTRVAYMGHVTFGAYSRYMPF